MALNVLPERSNLAAQERTSFLRRHAFEWLIGAVVASGVVAGLMISASRDHTASSAIVMAAPATPTEGPASSKTSPEPPAEVTLRDAKLPSPSPSPTVTLTDDAPNSESAEIATDADVRAAMLRELDGRSPYALPVLEDALRTDPITRNRLLAIKAMRMSGRNVALIGRVRTVLEAALNDADQNVATAARDVLAELPR